MNTYRVTINHEDASDVVVFVDREDHYWQLAEYLDRLQSARIIDAWDGEPVPVEPTAATVEWLRTQYNEKLENVESGYEQPYDDGGDSPGYRRDMIDAGRGHLLR